jgi:hypothetical protein
MAKSARQLLDSEGPTEVRVADFEQIGAKLGVLSFMKNRVRYDDIYNVNSPKNMKALLTVRKGKKNVYATLVPDQSDDFDGHPSVSEVRVG